MICVGRVSSQSSLQGFWIVIILTNVVSWVRESNMFIREILQTLDVLNSWIISIYIEGPGECEDAFWIILKGMAQQALQIPHEPDGFFDATGTCMSKGYQQVISSYLLVYDNLPGNRVWVLRSLVVRLGFARVDSRKQLMKKKKTIMVMRRHI